MKMSLALQQGVVYGPLTSRRFGNSLGINLLPDDQKVCLFDCVYCQYGPTDMYRKIIFPKLDQIEGEGGAAFSSAQRSGLKVDWIMIAGNGEPTLHPDFPEAVQLISDLRDRYLPKVPLGILSNSSTCYKMKIREGLMKLDGRFMKLDAGSSSLFQTINEPLTAFQWDKIVKGLCRLERIVLQSMFVTGAVDNTGSGDLTDWIKTVRAIKPHSVQIYTVDRPTRDQGILPVSKEVLARISQVLTKETRIPSIVF